MKRRVVAAVLLVAVLAACSSTSSTGAAPPASAAAARYPVTVAAANGNVTIAARPTHILSLSATATEMLYSIGAGSQVVGVDKYSTDPPNAPRTPFDTTESAESYARLHPDLVVVAFTLNSKLVAQLAALRIPTLMLPPAKTIDDTYSQLMVLGQATGHVVAAAQEDTTIRHKLDAIAASVGNRANGLTYYHEVESDLYSATSKTFIGALYGRLGMVNIADPADHTGSGYPQLSAEYVVKANPDYVFLADSVYGHQTAAAFAARPGFSVLKAVQQGHVVLVPDPVAAEWGPRVVDFLQDVANAVTK
jgi:iron complex transport system substrate-binding protein